VFDSFTASVVNSMRPGLALRLMKRIQAGLVNRDLTAIQPSILACHPRRRRLHGTGVSQTRASHQPNIPEPKIVNSHLNS